MQDQAIQFPSSHNIIAEPFFLDTPQGKLFAIYHRPVDHNIIRGQVLCVPPFNEEMNRCRSMITMQAQAFAKLGYGTLVFDLYGTGDSDGEYSDARWFIWLENINIGKAWLDQKPGGCRAIWGIRLGAILACESHVLYHTASISLILWQPVIDGKMHLTQFFRVRIAAQMDRADLPKETTTSMRAQLSSGGSIEVAGYEIHPELAAAIDKAHLSKLPLIADTAVLWLENSAIDKIEISPASQILLSQWRENHIDTNVQVFIGSAFWQMHERVLASDIIEKTSEWLNEIIINT